MDYQQSRAYIEEAQKYGSVLGLSNMRELMRRLGDPQDGLSCVHVAGTNGKGSVIAYLYTVLTEAGYRVGRYVSPTLYSYRERLEVSGRRIGREAFAGYMTRIAEAIGEMTGDGLPHPTPFEIETAAAFLYFREEACNLVLLEVGLGGDMDATNIIRGTKLAVLTSISMDHQAYLGDTLAEIARKKAGILKPGCRMVSAPQAPEAEKVIRSECGRLGIAFETPEEEPEILEEGLAGQSFRWRGEAYRLSLAGVCQTENAVLALKALEILSGIGYPTSPEIRRRGLEETRWNGRFTVIHERPLFIVDGAHNPGAARQLAASIEHYLKGRRICYIMGMFRDKDYRSVIRLTCSYAEKIWTIATPDNPRALPAQELAGEIAAVHGDVTAAGSIRQAVDAAFAQAGEDDVILAFGSLSFIGELTRIVKEREDKRG